MFSHSTGYKKTLHFTLNKIGTERYTFWLMNLPILASTMQHEKGFTQEMKTVACWSSLSITYLSSSEDTFFQHIIDILIGSKCAPLLVDLLLLCPKKKEPLKAT